jgi:hypothetical protein
MKGIDPDRWHDSSPDDPAVFSRVVNAAKDMGVSLPGDLAAKSAAKSGTDAMHLNDP